MRSEKHTATFKNSVNTEYDEGVHYCYLQVNPLGAEVFSGPWRCSDML